MEYLFKAVSALAPQKCFQFSNEPTTEAEFLTYFSFESSRDENGNVEFSNDFAIFPFTWEELSAKAAELQAEYDAAQYARDRRAEYPSIGDQLDALWKGGDDAAAMLEQVMAVKSKYPKPE